MGRIGSRYEVAHLLEGLIDNCSTLKQAKLLAFNWLAGDPNARADLRIFDAMARRGQPEEWGVHASGEWWIARYRPQ